MPYHNAKGSTLSSAESDYVALSSVAQEVIFLRNVLEFMQCSLSRVRIEVFEDNDGASQCVMNATSTCTKHVQCNFK
ncbi:unnamed protein product [Discosporangium mesarthrocarpum]